MCRGSGASDGWTSALGCIHRCPTVAKRGGMFGVAAPISLCSCCYGLRCISSAWGGGDCRGSAGSSSGSHSSPPAVPCGLLLCCLESQCGMGCGATSLALPAVQSAKTPTGPCVGWGFCIGPVVLAPLLRTAKHTIPCTVGAGDSCRSMTMAGRGCHKGWNGYAFGTYLLHVLRAMMLTTCGIFPHIWQVYCNLDRFIRSLPRGEHLTRRARGAEIWPHIPSKQPWLLPRDFLSGGVVLGGSIT